MSFLSLYFSIFFIINRVPHFFLFYLPPFLSLSFLSRPGRLKLGWGNFPVGQSATDEHQNQQCTASGPCRHFKFRASRDRLALVANCCQQVVVIVTSNKQITPNLKFSFETAKLNVLLLIKTFKIISLSISQPGKSENPTSLINHTQVRIVAGTVYLIRSSQERSISSAPQRQDKLPWTRVLLNRTTYASLEVFAFGSFGSREWFKYKLDANGGKHIIGEQLQPILVSETGICKQRIP